MNDIDFDNLARGFFSRIVSRRIYQLRLLLFRKRMTGTRLRTLFESREFAGDRFVPAFKERLRARFFVSDLNRKDFYVGLMTSLAGFDQIMDDADMIKENRFGTLGSGTYSFGDKIDWHLDFKSGKHWENKFYPSIDILDPGNPSDIKVAWEVSRLHQAIWLGKAYWVSGSETHARKFAELIQDWMDQNPVGYGVNWVMPMEAAIRAMNWIVGLLFFMGSASISDELFTKVLSSLYDHGVFIRYNLERSRQNGNHLISNLVGLMYIGILFLDTDQGKRWTNFAAGELEKAISEQVAADGVDYEKSTGYQRLVAELFTCAFVLMKLNGIGVSREFTARLERMYDFICAATTPDGTVPVIGDADDGRVFRTRYQIDFNDHRDLLAVGAVLFARPDYKSAAGRYSELALLLLGAKGFETFTSLHFTGGRKSEVFPEGGFAFLRTGNDSCSFDFGDMGKRGTGGHGHNDVLSFTLSGKIPFIVDRGTYCYSSDPVMRNRLRSTYSHNTAVVDRIEQADFAGLWSVKADLTRTRLITCELGDEQDIVEAEHHAYERLSDPVSHARRLTFNRKQRTLLIEDTFSGKGNHLIELMFHFHPDLGVVNAGRKFLVAEGDEFALIKLQHDFSIESWEHSPSYGVLQRAKTARMKLNADLPVKVETFIFILNDAEEVNHILNRI